MIHRLGPYELGPGGECGGIYTGDARELSKAIPDESVDLIFTDPVYGRIDDYRWLAEMAARVLKQDRALLTFCGVGYLPQTLEALCSNSLTWEWPLIYSNVARPQFHGLLGVQGVMCLWLQKGKRKMFGRVTDVNYVSPSRLGRFIQANGASWDKHPKMLGRYLSAFSPAGGVAIDPFAGSGTIPAVCKMFGRQYLAFEISDEAARLARECIRMTEPPLPGINIEQLSLEFES